MSVNDEAFVKEKTVRALTERMIGAVNALEFDPSMVGQATDAALSALASAGAANTARAATEAARDVTLARVDVLEAPAKAVLDDIMGGDVEGVAALARNAVVEGGATKHSGTQNVRNLRRPVLAVDAMFPNGRSQDQIVWVDEKGGKAWGIGLDGGLRTASWNMSTLQSEAEADIGSFAYSNATYFETADRKFCVNGLFFVTEDGALLMDVMEGEVRTIQRSTKASGGFAWSPVITFDGEVRALGPQSMAQDPITKALYFVEYTSGSTRTHIDILKSTDDGATWQVFKAMPKSDVSANTIRHWHCVQWDAVSGRMHFSAGDGNPDAGIYRVNAAGTDIEPVFLNKNINLGAYAPYAARCVGMMFFPTHVAWGTDGTNGQELVIRIHRNQIGLPEPAYEIIAEVDNATWFTQQASDDGTMWLLSASTEYMPAATIAGDDGVSHLYAITDNGSAVDEIAAIAMRTSGPTSLSPICGPSGGSTFWMRSHQYRESFAGISPLQFRARVGYGVVPLVKPRNVHPVVYSQESRNAVVELAAGETKTFGHTQSSKGIGNTLYMLNIGVKALSGAGVPKVQVWNGSTMLYEFSNISRRGSIGLAQEWIVRNPLSTYADIQFRVKETGGAPCTASVFVEFGFGK